MSNSIVNLRKDFGLIVIGDEILFGQREDRHFTQIRKLLDERDLRLARCYLLPDETICLSRHLKQSMAESIPVFVCGGIGATPDDLTRDCAAQAADLPLVRHPQAAALIVERFGQAAYPSRIRMADLPAGCESDSQPLQSDTGFLRRRTLFSPGLPPNGLADGGVDIG